MTITDANGETLTLPVAGGTFGWGAITDDPPPGSVVTRDWPTITATITRVRIYNRECSHVGCWLLCHREQSAKSRRKRWHRRARQERKAKRGWS